ncbi:hypothetical protein ACSV9I_08350 [Rhizobium sp. G187]|uniref:hypothetical protein n=1 Tax=Rhizobium sp. G187 TaxID=3451352 RepID=UPI003EE79EBE
MVPDDSPAEDTSADASVAEEPAPAPAPGEDSAADESIDANAASDDVAVDEAGTPPDEPAADPVASDAPPETEALSPEPVVVPSPTTGDRPVADAQAELQPSRRRAAVDAIEAAALAAYTGGTQRNDASAQLREQLQSLVAIEQNRGRDRAVDALQSRLVSGLLDDLAKPDDQQSSRLLANAPERSAETAGAAVERAVKAYRQV